MLISIVLLPLLGFLITILFGRFLGIGSCYLTFFNLVLSFIFSSLLLYRILSLGVNYKLVISPWIYSDYLQINWGFLFDSVTVVMLFVITFISSLVHLYSLEYMENDPHIVRFMSYLSLFTFFMLLLVTADNFLQMFVGWEGVGLASYLLINFWFTRIQANKSAIKAMLVNRIGDFAILFGLFSIIFFFGSLDYDVVLTLASKIEIKKINIFFFNFSYIDLIALLLFLGAMGKSAQFGLHTWLPDAMEGPTPVSALIHAATMVTAGVFLIIRCSFFFDLSNVSLNVLLVIGSLTTFFASSVGLFQNDIKKIIAYSTCSQLGYMVFACGLSGYDVAIFHLSNHAFFKALLFLGAGAVIHGINDEQDIRKMGGLRLKMPLTYAVILIGSCALAGFPFLSGFYSKDVILELAYSKYTAIGHFAFFLGTFSVFSTSFYSMRLLYMVFLAEPNINRQNLLHAHEPGIKMLLPLCLLCIFSIFVGFLTKDFFIGLGSSFWRNAIFVIPEKSLFFDVEFVDAVAKVLPFVLSCFGCIIAIDYCHKFPIYVYKLKNFNFFKMFYTFLNKRWYFDRVYNQIISQNLLYSGFNFSYIQVDRGILEQFGPLGIVTFVKHLSNYSKSFQIWTIFHNFVFFYYSLYFFFIITFLFFFISEIFIVLIFLIFTLEIKSN